MNEKTNKLTDDELNVVNGGAEEADDSMRKAIDDYLNQQANKLSENELDAVSGGVMHT